MVSNKYMLFKKENEELLEYIKFQLENSIDNYLLSIPIYDGLDDAVKKLVTKV